MAATVWGLKQIDPTSNSIYVANVKARDFQPCEPFIIKGRPCLDDTGYFEMPNPPGYAGELSDHVERKSGRPAKPDTEDKRRQAEEMHANGKSYQEIALTLDVPKSTVAFWLKSKAVQ